MLDIPPEEWKIQLGSGQSPLGGPPPHILAVDPDAPGGLAAGVLFPIVTIRQIAKDWLVGDITPEEIAVLWATPGVAESLVLCPDGVCPPQSDLPPLADGETLMRVGFQDGDLFVDPSVPATRRPAKPRAPSPDPEWRPWYYGTPERFERLTASGEAPRDGSYFNSPDPGGCYNCRGDHIRRFCPRAPMIFQQCQPKAAYGGSRVRPRSAGAASSAWSNW